MACELAIRNPYLAARPDSGFSRLLQRLSERVEQIRVHMASSAEERNARRIFSLVADAVSGMFNNDERFRTIANNVLIVVCRTDKEFVEAFHTAFPNDEEKEKAIARVKRDSIKGWSSKNRQLTCINLKQIKDSTQTKEEIEAGFVLTVIHELLHHFENVSYHVACGSTEYRTEWLNEGFVELTAKDIMRSMYKKQFYNLGEQDRESHIVYEDMVLALAELIGMNSIENAFFRGGFRVIEQRMRELGFSQQDIETTLALGERTKKEEDGYSVFTRHIDQMKKKRKRPPEEETEDATPRRREPQDSERHRDGLSRASIEEVRRALGPEHQESAPRIALMATLYHNWCLRDKNAAPADIASTVSRALERAGGIPAYAERELAREVTGALERTADVCDFTLPRQYPVTDTVDLPSGGSPPYSATSPPTSAAQGAGMLGPQTSTVQPIADMTEPGAIELPPPIPQIMPDAPNSAQAPQNDITYAPVNIEPQFVAPVSDGRELSQAIDLKLGDRVDFDSANLVQAAVLNYAITNDGRLPEPQQVLQTVYDAYQAAGSEKYVMPDVSIVADQLVVDTTRCLQDTSLPQSMDWVRETTSAALPYYNPTDTQNSLTQPYAPDTSEITREIRQITDFGAFAPTIADTAAALFAQQGVQPTNADIYGLALGAFEVAKQSGLVEYFTAMESGISEHNPAAEATLRVMMELNGEMRTDALSQIDTNPSFRDVPSSVQQYWEQRVADPSRIDSLSSATQVFASLLEIRHPAEAIGFDQTSGIVRVAPDGKTQLPDGVDYSISANIMGATGVRTDIRLVQKGSPTAAHVEAPTMGRFEPAHYTKPLPDIGASDPLQLTPEISAISRRVTSIENPVERLRKLFDILKSDGELEIKGSMFMEDRSAGSLAPADVLRQKTANCLESTSLFVLAAEEAFKHDRKARVVALDVIHTEQRVEIPHACVGVLLENHEITGHPRFASDWGFRASVLSELGVNDSPGLKFLVIDPVNNIFDYRFHNVRPLDKKKLASMLHSNSAGHYRDRGDEGMVRKCTSDALRLWSENPFAVVSYVGRHAKQEPRKCFEMLEHLDPEYLNSRVYHSMAVIAFMHLNNRELAMKCLEQAFRLDATNVNVLHMKSYLHASEPDEENLRTAAVLLPQLIKLYSHLRRQALKHTAHSVHSDKTMDRVEAAKIKQEMTSDLVGAYRSLALVYLSLHEFDQAIKVAEKGSALYPEDNELRFIRGFAYLEVADQCKMMTLTDGTRPRVFDQTVELYSSKAEQIFGGFSGSDGFEVSLGMAAIERLGGRDNKTGTCLDRVRAGVSRISRHDHFYQKIFGDLVTAGIFGGDSISVYCSFFRMVKADELNPVARNANSGWLIFRPSSLTLPTIYVEDLNALPDERIVSDEPASPAQFKVSDDLIARLASSSAQLNRALDKTRALAEPSLHVLNSDLPEVEKAVLLQLIRERNDKHFLQKCAAVWFFRVLRLPRIPAADEDAKAEEIGRALNTDPFSLEPRLFRELTSMARENMPSEAEIIGFTREVLAQLGKQDTPENIEEYKPWVRKVSCMPLDPFGKLGHLDVRVRSIGALD